MSSDYSHSYDDKLHQLENFVQQISKTKGFEDLGEVFYRMVSGTRLVKYEKTALGQSNYAQLIFNSINDKSIASYSGKTNSLTFHEFSPFARAVNSFSSQISLRVPSKSLNAPPSTPTSKTRTDLPVNKPQSPPLAKAPFTTPPSTPTSKSSLQLSDVEDNDEIFSTRATEFDDASSFDDEEMIINREREYRDLDEYEFEVEEYHPDIHDVPEEERAANPNVVIPKRTKLTANIQTFDTAAFKNAQTIAMLAVGLFFPVIEGEKTAEAKKQNHSELVSKQSVKTTQEPTKGKPAAQRQKVVSKKAEQARLSQEITASARKQTQKNVQEVRKQKREAIKHREQKIVLHETLDAEDKKQEL